jgi:hypothetical protein
MLETRDTDGVARAFELRATRLQKWKERMCGLSVRTRMPRILQLDRAVNPP